MSFYLGSEWRIQASHTYHSDSKDEDEEEGGKTDDNDSDEPLRDKVAIFILLDHTYPFPHDWNMDNFTCPASLTKQK